MNIHGIGFAAGVGGRDETNVAAPNGRASEESGSLLAPPLPGCDDATTTLATLMIKLRQQDRAMNDRAHDASTKAADEAHEHKIDAMRDLADSELVEGVLTGSLEGAAAAASAASAVTEFDGAMKGAAAGSTDDGALTGAARSARDAKLLDAESARLQANSKFAGAACRAAEDGDRKDMEIADADVDRAKASGDVATTASNRAAEDVRATVDALRQVIEAKSRLANAVVLRG